MQTFWNLGHGFWGVEQQGIWHRQGRGQGGLWVTSASAELAVPSCLNGCLSWDPADLRFTFHHFAFLDFESLARGLRPIGFGVSCSALIRFLNSLSLLAILILVLVCANYGPTIHTFCNLYCWNSSWCFKLCNSEPAVLIVQGMQFRTVNSAICDSDTAIL